VGNQPADKSHSRRTVKHSASLSNWLPRAVNAPFDFIVAALIRLHVSKVAQEAFR
jgi:hypothetical protein